MHKANGHGANTSISYNTCIRSTVDLLGVIPLKHAFSERVEFVEGSSGTRGSVVEVVVLVTVVEVVVHGCDGSCSGSWRVVMEGLAASPGIVVHLVLSDERQW